MTSRMIFRQGMPKIFLLLATFLLLYGCTQNGPLARVADVTAVFPFDSEATLLTYQDKDARVTLFTIVDGRFVEQASITALSPVQRAIALSDSIVIAYGYGRGKLQDPIRIVQYDRSLQNPKELLTHQSERNEVAELVAVPERNAIFVSFFTSKYMTKAGWLHLDGTFEEVTSTRLGTQYDVEGDWIVQGRPYGDDIGIDGDVTLLRGTGSQRLPSFRGVSEVQFAQIDDDPELEILIADGWHQNYGQMAEPRVSLLDKQGSGYTLTTFATLRPQYAISTIHPLAAGEKRYLFVVGNSSADIIDLADRSVRNIYTSSNMFFSAAFVGQKGTEIQVAIKEDDLWLTTFGL
jgi:hypothetical protein